jgi:hypothetical protein
MGVTQNTLSAKARPFNGSLSRPGAMIRVGAWTQIIKIVLDKWRKVCYTIYVKGSGSEFCGTCLLLADEQVFQIKNKKS